MNVINISLFDMWDDFYKLHALIKNSQLRGISFQSLLVHEENTV